MKYETVIGLEVHAELLTESKMFCSCPVVDSTQAEPNVAVCPVCAGMPGVLPVVNRKAVEYGLRVALALECEIAHTSIFARKNYFYPDLPKGYQISQYEYPLAERGRLVIHTTQGERVIRIRRVHLEEDTGKLTHMQKDGEAYSLVDLNRAGVALLEIVTEPDMHSAEEVQAYGRELRALIRSLGVNTGNMEKGVMRFEANVSIRPEGSQTLGTRTEIKNLNSFRSLERAVEYEVLRQSALLDSGGRVLQETLGWDEAKGETFSQRSKEEAHDYRYFPEPDLPPLLVEKSWVNEIASHLPELPRARIQRYQRDYGLSAVDAAVIVNEQPVSDFFEQTLTAAPGLPARVVANWITGEIFGWLNQCEGDFDCIKVTPVGLAALLQTLETGEINMGTAKSVLSEMLTSGKSAREIIEARGLQQISDAGSISSWVSQTLRENPGELAAYLAGKETLSNWFFGQVMRIAGGRANPQVVRAELEKQLNIARVQK